LERDYPGKVIMWKYFHLLSTSQYSGLSNLSGTVCIFFYYSCVQPDWKPVI
jgi:hypothetical protein